jgi:hypothetical protein
MIRFPDTGKRNFLPPPNFLFSENLGAVSPTVKTPGSEAGHSQSCDEGKIAWSYTTPYVFMLGIVANLAVNLRSKVGRYGLNSCRSRQRSVERCSEHDKGWRFFD